jgi:uncharacterized protein
VPEVICDVSPIQYLHQVGLLDLLRLRYGAITIPPAVLVELREGTLRGGETRQAALRLAGEA